MKSCGYFVSFIGDLTTKTTPHFVKYPLITQKLGDFLLFEFVVEMVNLKKRLTMEGLQKIVSFKASVNLGLIDVLKAAFPETVPALKPLIVITEKPHPYWMAGFASRDGCFAITENKFSSKNIVRLLFSLSQHSRDESLVRSLAAFFFCCGTYSPSSLGRTTVSLKTYRFSDNYNKIMPFS